MVGNNHNKGVIMKRKLRVEKSLYPEEEKTHILVLETETEHGGSIGRIFKGTRRECFKRKKEMEDKNGK